MERQSHDIVCCGADCAHCQAFPTECAGCWNTEGCVPWTEFLQLERCPIYRCCVLEQARSNCGGCPRFPCQRFYDTKNPSMTEEEFAADLRARSQNLRSRSK